MKYIFFTIAFILFGGATVHASEIVPSEIRIADKEGNYKNSFPVLSEKNIGSFSVAATDLGLDGIAEIIVGSGTDSQPRVYIYAQDGLLISSFLAYAPTFNKGVYLATGDLDGDGLNEIVTGTGFGGGPHVRIFDGQGVNRKTDFFAYDKSSRSGVFVTVRDLNGDDKAEIITGAGAGEEPWIKVFSGTGDLKAEFLAFDITDTSGVTVGTADTNSDGVPEIIAGHSSSDISELKIFSAGGVLQKTLTIFEYIFKGGITAHGADCNADGQEDLLISSNGTDARLQCMGVDSTLIRSFDIFATDMSGSVQAVWAKLSFNDSGSLIVAASRGYKKGNANLAQEIRVSLDEQRLYAYEYGLLAKTFLISSGVNKFPTPKGKYSVQKKIPIKDYVWTYGLNNPHNYNLPNVKWNLQFRPRYYLHYAYWHNNFGNKMSHGCVNMPLAASEWIYNWAIEGTPVTID